MKRILSFLLVLTMLCSFGLAFAQEEAPAEEPAAEEVIETASEEPAAEEPAEEPVEEPAEEAAETPAEEPAEEPAEAPAEEIEAGPTADGETTVTTGQFCSDTRETEFSFTPSESGIYVFNVDTAAKDQSQVEVELLCYGDIRSYTDSVGTRIECLLIAGIECTLSVSYYGQLEYVDYCIYVEQIPVTALSAETSCTGSITGAGDEVWYSFTPSESGTYVFSSAGEANVRAGVFNDNFTEVQRSDSYYDDDCGNFSVEWDMELGETWLFLVSSPDAAAEFTVSIAPAAAGSITYDVNGGEDAPDATEFTVGESVTLAEAEPTRDGYDFLGWAADSAAATADYAAGESITPEDSMTLYAVWAKILTSGRSYTAEIGKAGGAVCYEFTPDTAKTYVMNAAGSDVTITLYSEDGTELTTDTDGRLAYFLAADTIYLYTVSYDNAEATGSIPCTFGRVYTVKYKANGGSGAPAAQTKDYGKGLTLSSTIPTKAGYVFVGWSTKSGAETANWKAGDVFHINSNTTLYAVWREDVPTTKLASSKTYKASIAAGETVYYEYTPTNANSYVIYASAGDAIDVTIYDSYHAVKAVSSTANGRAACAMKAGETYLIAVSFSDASDSGRVTLKFGRAYSVKFNANGGSSAPATQTHDYGTALTLTDSVPTQDGYTFAGWSVGRNGAVRYQPGNAYTANGNVTLYAVWETED